MGGNWASRSAVLASGIALCFAAVAFLGDDFAGRETLLISVKASLHTFSLPEGAAAAAAGETTRPALSRTAAAAQPGSAAAASPGSTGASLARIAKCESFACLRREQQRVQTRFKFPHFFLVGFAKCATTSIAASLRKHPEVLYPSVAESPWYRRGRTGGKEAHFFDKECFPKSATRVRCQAESERYYIQNVLRLPEAAASDFTLAAWEATPKYAKQMYSDDLSLAGYLGRAMPWLRIILSVREPLSQAMSYCGHMNKIETDGGMAACLDWRFGLSADGSAYERTQPMLKNYTVPVSRWLREYPASQVHVIQYEELIDGEHEVAVLQRLTDFLGLAPQQRSLEEKNIRSTARCWKVDRRRLEAYLASARADAHGLAALLEERGLASAAGWLAAWQAVWGRMLASCTPQGQCCLSPS